MAASRSGSGHLQDDPGMSYTKNKQSRTTKVTSREYRRQLEVPLTS